MTGTIPPAERLAAQLRALYQRYGFKQYRVSKFEEYDLYARNKRFLTSPHILTFSDTNGRLMALKPDITLSIINNTRDDDRTRKVWYTENVYRVPRGGGGFQEIMQAGLEMLGTVDLYAMGEVLMLAARSLEAVSPRYVLELSHMGILTGVLDTLAVPAGAAEAILAAFEAKNAHGLASVCAGAGVDAADAALLERLCRLSGPARSAVKELLTLPLPPAAKQAAVELDQLTGLLTLFGPYNATVDLSLINDTDYYNGLLFRGYVDGVAAPVLTGGRYDSLIHRMGKRGGAIGFAVYLNELERFLAQPAAQDVDTLLVYGPGDDPAVVVAAVQAEVARGRTVRAQLAGETAVTYGRCIRPDGKEMT